MYSYIAKFIEKIENKPGTWNSIKVGVFRVEGDNETQIGEYVRNYPTLFRTFYHFSKNEKDYALVLAKLHRDKSDGTSIVS